MTSLLITCFFWAALACIIYTYTGYPILLWFLSRVSPHEVSKAPIFPVISIVIAARNEAAIIARRLDNLLAQDYPLHKVEIIVISDGSTDSTNEIVSSYFDRNVRLVKLENRMGKAEALNQGVAVAKGEIIIFTDARQQFEPDAVSELVANFNDPLVGCVSGELVLVKDDRSQIQAEMGFYWNYEKWIRKMESRTGSVVGATGAIYAIRRELFIPLPADIILDDVLTPLNIIQQGFHCIFEKKAVAHDLFSIDSGQEWRRKVRTLTGNWQLLGLRPGLLLPWRNPCWWRFISHKVLRTLVPFALIVLFISGFALSGDIYLIAALLQSLLYAMALAGLTLPFLRTLRIISFCYFFLIMNTAAVAGFWCWLTGKSNSVWQAGAAVSGDQTTVCVKGRS